MPEWARKDDRLGKRGGSRSTWTLAINRSPNIGSPKILCGQNKNGCRSFDLSRLSRRKGHKTSVKACAKVLIDRNQLFGPGCRKAGVN